jgi:hypothetical protein
MEQETREDTMEEKEVRPPSSIVPFIIGCLCALTFMFVIYYVIPNAIGLLRRNDPKVDKDHCGCMCFDGLNKGKYGRGGYKFVYWNMDKETYIIVMLWFLYFAFFVRTIERVLNLFREGRLNYFWLFVLLCSIQPTFYSMWALWNYINDRIYHLYYHQIYFTVTETINFVVIYQYLDRTRDLGEYPLWTVIFIGLTHLIQSVWDQGISHFFNAGLDLLLRDCALMIGDLPLVVVAIVCLHHITSWKQRISSQKLFLSCLIGGMMATMIFLSNITYGG